MSDLKINRKRFGGAGGVAQYSVYSLLANISTPFMGKTLEGQIKVDLDTQKYDVRLEVTTCTRTLRVTHDQKSNQNNTTD